MTIEIPEGYEALGLALGEAVAQASHGKGAERHAGHGEKFSDQLIMSIPRRLGEGGECFCLGQALKKIYESRRLEPAHARAEILGAINYLAAAWGLLGGFKDAFGESPVPDRLFSPGADVEFRAGCGWLRGAYVRPLESGMHEVLHGSSLLAVKEPSLRKAEPEHVRAPDGGDAPRTKEELFERIRGCNPAVYGPSPAPDSFAPGDAVEWLGPDGWTAALFDREANGQCFLSSGGRQIVVPRGRVRRAESASAPEEREEPPLRFERGDPVEWLEKDASEWRCGRFWDVEDGMLVVRTGAGGRVRVSPERVRKPSPAPDGAPAGAPLFAEGTPVEYADRGVWKPGVYVGADPEGSHVVEFRGVRRHLDGILLRKA